MLKFFQKIFDGGQKVDLAELIGRGAIILDVRTQREFRGGHLKNSTNIPLDELQGKISQLDGSKPVITCCATGMRSLTAKNILRNSGFPEVYNGGSWTSLKKFEN
jgi:phage shock protein E